MSTIDLDARRRSGNDPTTRLRALFEREYEPMVRLAYLMVDSSAVAEELVQEAFARVHDNWDRIRGDGGGYLRTTVVNACRDHLRRSWRETALEHEPQTAAAPEPRRGLHASLQRLSPRRRAAIVLRYYEGLDDERIAEILDCRRATVRSLVHRGLGDLREELEA